MKLDINYGNYVKLVSAKENFEKNNEEDFLEHLQKLIDEEIDKYAEEEK